MRNKGKSRELLNQPLGENMKKQKNTAPGYKSEAIVDNKNVETQKHKRIRKNKSKVGFGRSEKTFPGNGVDQSEGNVRHAMKNQSALKKNEPVSFGNRKEGGFQNRRRPPNKTAVRFPVTSIKSKTLEVPRLPPQEERKRRRIVRRRSQSSLEQANDSGLVTTISIHQHRSNCNDPRMRKLRKRNSSTEDTVNLIPKIIMKYEIGGTLMTDLTISFDGSKNLMYGRIKRIRKQDYEKMAKLIIVFMITFFVFVHFLR